MRSSFKMYLSIFITTSCIYMILYQYHVSTAQLFQAQQQPQQLHENEFKVDKNLNDKRQDKITSTSIRTSTTVPTTIIITTTTARTKTRTTATTVEYTKNGKNPLSSSSPSLTSSKSSHSKQISQNKTFSLSPSPSSSSPSSLSSISSFLKSFKFLTSKIIKKKKSVIINNSNTKKPTATTILNRTRTTSTTASAPNLLDGNKIINDSKIQIHKEPDRNLARNEKNKIRNSSNAIIITRDRIKTKLNAKSRFIEETNTKKSFTPDASSIPPLYVITPTYRRPEQLAELTRLGYTLKHVPNLLWLVIEDAEKPSHLVTKVLKRIGVAFEYLTAPMPSKYRKNKVIPRGVSNRNRGLQWLRANATEGVFYFADDDNTYDVNIFEEMRYTKKVSMWPVGLVTKLGVSSPILRKGKLAGFYDGWIANRKYPVDMAGFAVSIKFLLERPNATMPYKAGYEEDGFLKSLTPLNNSDIELLASNCTEILTWHTQTKKNEVAQKLNMTKYGDTNLVSLTKMLVGKQ